MIPVRRHAAKALIRCTAVMGNFSLYAQVEPGSRIRTRCKKFPFQREEATTATLLWDQRNMPEKRARQTNPHKPLLNHSGKVRLCFTALQSQVAAGLELQRRCVHSWEKIPASAASH